MMMAPMSNSKDPPVEGVVASGNNSTVPVDSGSAPINGANAAVPMNNTTMPVKADPVNTNMPASTSSTGDGVRVRSGSKQFSRTGSGSETKSQTQSKQSNTSGPTNQKMLYCKKIYCN